MLLFLQCQIASAVVADALILVKGNLLIAAAEDTAGLVLAQNDGIALGVNLQRITASHVQRLAQFDGQSDSAQIVDMSDNTGGFHKNVPP